MNDVFSQVQDDMWRSLFADGGGIVGKGKEYKAYEGKNTKGN